MSKISLWDDPSDYDDNSDKPAKKKLSWWQEFERDDDVHKQKKEAADPYSYREAFDDTADSWHRKNKFTHSHYRDYSPSRLFRHAFSGIGFWSAQDTGEISATNALNNKVIRALRVLTRNVNTVADKAAKITYEVHISRGTDANQSAAHYVEGSVGKQRKQVIFISPDEIAAAKTPDADDAVIDALTGFVLLRVQIAQSVPRHLLDAINETGKTVLPAKIITLATTSRGLTRAELAEKATEYTDNYLAGAIAKNLLVRLARRGVVQDWGGFSPYFVRHAKKFAATREALTDENEPDSVERLVMRVAYNLIDDENQIPLAAEVNKIVDAHLSEELNQADILRACNALVADLRAYWISTLPEDEAASPPLGKIEEALAKLFKDFSRKKKHGPSKAKRDAGDGADNCDDDAEADEDEEDTDEDEEDTENILNDLLDLFDSLNEIGVQYTNANKFADSLAAIEKEINTAKEINHKGCVADQLTDVAKYCKTSSEPRTVWLKLEGATKHLQETVPEHISKSIDTLLSKLAANAMTPMSPDGAAEFSKEITNVGDELRATIKQDIETSRDNIKKIVTGIAALIAERIERVRGAAKKSADIAAKAAGDMRFEQSTAVIAGLTAADIEAGLTSDADDMAKSVTKLTGATLAHKARSAGGLHKMLQAARALLNDAATGGHSVASKMKNAGKTATVMSKMIKASEQAFYDEVVKAGTGSVYKVPAEYHAYAISAAMDSPPTKDKDNFTASVLRSAHSDLLEYMREALQHDGASVPSYLHDANPQQKKLLARLADNYGVPAGMLLAMLRTAAAADPVGASMGRAIREVVNQLGNKDSSVDEELFGKPLTNATTLKSNAVNDEASKAVEEEYVTYLSHNSARPTIIVKRPNKADANLFGRGTAKLIKSRNRAVITSIRNALQFQNDKRVGEVHGLLSGDLDEGGLHKLRYDSEHIWSQKTLTNLPDVAVGILVDQSGSMASSNKIEQARETCIVLAEALKQINGMHLHIYGHTANQTGRSDLTLFEHYSSYGDASAADLSNLGLISAHSNNYDGYAIKEAAHRLNQDPAKKKYLFVIADGQPAGSGYNGKEAEKHVTSVCTYVRKKLQIATYAFAVGAFDSGSENKFRAQYGADNVVFISTVKAALPKIVRFLRNALQKEKQLSNATTT